MFVLRLQTPPLNKVAKAHFMITAVWCMADLISQCAECLISAHGMISVIVQTVTIWTETRRLASLATGLQMVDLRYSEWSCKGLIKLCNSNRRSHIMEEVVYRGSVADNPLLRCALWFSFPANTKACPWKCHKGDISHYWWIFQWGRPKTHCSILAWVWSRDLHLRDMAGQYPRTEWHGIPPKRGSLLPSSQLYWVWSSGTQGSSWRYYCTNLRNTQGTERSEEKEFQYCLVFIFHAVLIPLLSFLFFLFFFSIPLTF